MANIRRFDKLGRIWIKNYFDGVLDNGDGSDAGKDMVMFAKIFPAMTIPHRMWLSWKIFTDPEEDDDLLPHVQHQMRLTFRAANITNTESPVWSTPAMVQDNAEQYLQEAENQLESEEMSSDDVGMYGGFVQTQQGRSKNIMSPRNYILGLPNHAMLTKSNNIMMHCVGSVNSDDNKLAIPKSVDIERPYFIAFTVSRQQMESGTGDNQAMHDHEQHSISGAFATTDDLYSALLDAIPRPYSTNEDYTISTDQLNDQVKDWQTRGYPNGTYADSNMPNLHYAVRFTAETSIYAPKNSNTIKAP